VYIRISLPHIPDDITLTNTKPGKQAGAGIRDITIRLGPSNRAKVIIGD
jgi:hypothetical protein